jgi:hypothetical protein
LLIRVPMLDDHATKLATRLMREAIRAISMQSEVMWRRRNLPLA